jgi:hypothetical protein
VQVKSVLYESQLIVIFFGHFDRDRLAQQETKSLNEKDFLERNSIFQSPKNAAKVKTLLMSTKVRPFFQKLKAGH